MYKVPGTVWHRIMFDMTKKDNFWQKFTCTEQTCNNDVTLIRKADLENHNKDGGQWIVIGGQVYDIEDFRSASMADSEDITKLLEATASQGKYETIDCKSFIILLLDIFQLFVLFFLSNSQNFQFDFMLIAKTSHCSSFTSLPKPKFYIALNFRVTTKILSIIYSKFKLLFTFKTLHIAFKTWFGCIIQLFHTIQLWLVDLILRS